MPSRRIYTCPSALTAAGYDLEELAPGDRWDLVHMASALVDNLTDQWFNGEAGPPGGDGHWYFDGPGRELLAHVTLIPIQFLTEVEILSERTHYRYDPIFEPGFGSGTLLDLTTCVNRGRALERAWSVWPSGAHNIKLTAILGWIDALSAPVETTSTAALDGTDTTLTVLDSTGFAARQIVDIFSETESVRVRLTAVDPATHTLTFDALGDQLPATMLSGASVRTFGQVPAPIVKLTNFLVGKMLETEAQVPDALSYDSSKIKREKTDDYEYELQGDVVSAARSVLTGHSFYDSIVRMFSRPVKATLV